MDKTQAKRECYLCGSLRVSKEMLHSQTGFSVRWKCRDREACTKRVAAAKKRDRMPSKAGTTHIYVITDKEGRVMASEGNGALGVFESMLSARQDIARFRDNPSGSNNLYLGGHHVLISNLRVAKVTIPLETRPLSKKLDEWS